MKHFFLIFLTLLAIHTSWFLFPLSKADSPGIHIRISENSPTHMNITLEAHAITKPLVGISTLLHIPNSVRYESYTPGQFFEYNQNQVTYLISTKKRDPQTVVIGIASLGKTALSKEGSIVTLHFKKLTSRIEEIPLTISNATASGIENTQRINYADITWTIDHELSKTGTSTLLAITCTAVVILVLIVLKNLFQRAKVKEQRSKMDYSSQ